LLSSNGSERSVAAVIDRVLDRFLPTRSPPAPTMESVDDPRVLLDRGIALVIDVAFCYVFVEAPVIYVLGEVFPDRFEALVGTAALLSLIALLPIYVTYSFAFEWLYGRTPGKVNRGLLVVMEDGRRCTLRASAIRNLLKYVDLLGVPPLVVGLFSVLLADGRRVGDLVAGTVVTRARVPDDVHAAATADVDASASGRARSRDGDGAT
jgi:uncharacterized RDD family membrane protein YckC